MKKLDMRCRPPLPSLLNGWVYSPTMKDFTTKFAGGSLPESVVKRDMDLCIAEMKALDMQGYICLRKAGNEKVNAEVADFLKEHGDMFYGAVGLDLHDMDVALKEIDEYVVNGPFIGVNLEPNLPATGHEDAFMLLDDERIFPIYEKCQEHNIPVTITHGGPSFGELASKQPERVSRVLTTFPKMKLGLTHGAWPFFNAGMVALLAGLSNFFIGIDSYVLGLPGWRDYVDAANYICQDQIMFGTSYPLNSQAEVVAYYETAGFRPEIMHKVYYDNAARFLGLKDEADREPSAYELIMSAW